MRRFRDNRGMNPGIEAPIPGTVYQHWKGGLYRVESLATLEATGDVAVVYRPLAAPGSRPWIRPLPDFVEQVAGRDGSARQRFLPLPLPDDRALRAAASAAEVPQDVVDATLSRYREPHRFYHASWHVHDVFARAAERSIPLTRAQVLGLLFHDAVYVAGAAAGANEALSALLLRQAADRRDALSPADVERACALVLDTAGHRPSVPGSLEVIALDLATLSDSPLRFDAWTELVWLEYRHLFTGEVDPKAAYLRRRLRVLGELLDSTRDLDLGTGFHDRFAANLERLAAQDPPS